MDWPSSGARPRHCALACPDRNRAVSHLLAERDHHLVHCEAAHLREARRVAVHNPLWERANSGAPPVLVGFGEYDAMRFRQFAAEHGGALVVLFKATDRNGELGAHVFTLRKDGFDARTPFKESLHQWQGISSIILFKHCLYVRLNWYLFYIVPARAFTSRADFDRFFSC